MKISDYIKPDTVAIFQFYTDGELWYRLSNSNFQFPVPIDDAKGAVLNKTEKGVFLMRWVRKHLEKQEAEQEMIAKLKAEWEEEQSKKG